MEVGEIRRGRQEEPSRRSKRGLEGICPTHSGLGNLLSSQAIPLSSKAPSRLPGSLATQGRSQGDQERQGGGSLQDQTSRRGEEGVCTIHLSPGSLLGSQMRSPPSETRGGGMSGHLLFLETKPHPTQHPGPFPALWVLIIGHTHHPNLAFV